MRGTSRREDNVFWIIKLSEEDFEEAGCQFSQRFEKNRNAPRDPDSDIWTFKSLPNGLVESSYEISTLVSQLVERLRNVPTSAGVLTNEFKLPHSTINRELNRGVTQEGRFHQSPASYELRMKNSESRTNKDFNVIQKNECEVVGGLLKIGNIGSRIRERIIPAIKIRFFISFGITD